MTKFDRRWASVVVALYTAMVTGSSYGYVYDVYVSLRVAQFCAFDAVHVRGSLSCSPLHRGYITIYRISLLSSWVDVPKIKISGEIIASDSVCCL